MSSRAGAGAGAGAGDFQNRVVLVTGVGRAGQIGNAVALAFGKAGAKIVACDLNAVDVCERVREFAALGVDARPCAGDLTQPDVAALAVETALKHFGRLDVVVNVAGGLTTYGPIGDITVQSLDREIAINLKTTVLVSQAAIEALTSTRGSIVNFASIAHFEPQAPMAVYTAAKSAVAGFTRSLALELRDRGIRVNAVAPSMVRTGDNVAAVGDGDAQYVEMSDITGGVMSLASPVSSQTGEVLRITPARAGTR
jgi:NAD(P)-dependent dehydrogenase (short-subunit alcohol dehydrogenase family)